MLYDDSLIVGKVPKKIKKRTKENMEVYNMSLSDSFEEAVKELAKEGSELWKAWYYSDFRKFIPSAYLPEYLDFSKYPLNYTTNNDKKKTKLLDNTINTKANTRVFSIERRIRCTRRCST